MDYPDIPASLPRAGGVDRNYGGDAGIGPARTVALVLGVFVLLALLIVAAAAAQRVRRGESWGEANYNVLRASTPLYNTPTDKLYELSVEGGRLSLKAQDAAARVAEMDRQRHRRRY